MHIVGAGGQCLTLKPLAASIRDSVAVSIFEFPDGGRCSAINGPVEPKNTLGEHQLIGEDGALIELAITVGIFEANDPVRFFGELFLHLVIAAGGVRHIKPPLLIEIAGDRSVNPWWPGDLFEHKTVR